MTEEILPGPEQSPEELMTATLERYFSAYRPDCIQEVMEAGGSRTDGATFFRVALLQWALENRGLKEFDDVETQAFLLKISVAQYRDWIREQTAGDEKSPAEAYEEEDSTETPPTHSAENLRRLRRMIKAKRVFDRLPDEQKNTLRAAALSGVVSEDAASVLTGFRSALGAYDKYWEEPMPDWALTAFSDDYFERCRKRLDELELAKMQEETTEEKPVYKDRIWPKLKKALLVVAVLLAGRLAYDTWFRPRTVQEVFEDNFQAPKSIVEDLARKPWVSPDDSLEVVRPAHCDEVLEAADRHYKAKQWRAAARKLYELLDEEEYEVCRSEGYFYIGVIALKTGDPYLTLQCFAKLDDLERFGEDVYWYQALAYVRIAVSDAMEKENAVRAVERAMSNTADAERKAQCAQMLEQLNR